MGDREAPEMQNQDLQRTRAAAQEASEKYGPAATALAVNASAFNLEEAIRLCFRRKEIFQNMVETFFKETDRLFPQMRAALQKGDVAEVGSLGHRLKGTIVYLGAKQATDAALLVEQFAKQPGQMTEVEQAVSALERECEILRSVLATHRSAACAPGTE